MITDINKLHKGDWSYKAECFKKIKRGSGKNFCQGYTEEGPLLKDFVFDALRKEIESFDQFSGFLLIGSAVSGTGGGVAAYVSEILSAEYPSVSSANIVS